MADWKVSVEKLALFDHPNANALACGKLGMFQIVVGKSNGYADGDLVVFAPKRSVLPEEIRKDYCNTETGASYLSGKEHDRVSHVKLRGELSEGVTISPAWVCEKLGVASLHEIPVGEDLSERLGITLYEPPMPAGFAGQLARLQVGRYSQHDVEQINIYAGEFTPGEEVIATEKIHGSQLALLIEENGTPHISSKGMFGKGLELLEDEKNIYWRAVRNTNLIDILVKLFPGQLVQAFGEAVPAQGGNWTYGVNPNHPRCILFRLEVGGRILSVDEAKSVDEEINKLWTPVPYKGPFDIEKLREIAKGKEQVSGKELHIREGIVVSPKIPRLSSEGFPLYVKVINPRFKDLEDDIS